MILKFSALLERLSSTWRNIIRGCKNQNHGNGKSTMSEEETKQGLTELWKGLSGWHNPVQMPMEGEGELLVTEMH